MLLSIIICTYNREKYIYNVLKSIAKNNFPYENFEIILINNNSNDNSENEYFRFQKDYPEIKSFYFIEKNQGLSHARNRGIIEANGDILIFVDDDAEVNSDYLNSYYTFFNQHKDIHAAGGPIIPKYETEEPKWFSYHTKRLVTGYSYFGNKIHTYKNETYPGGGNAAYRKSVFETIGYYNTNLGRKGNNLIGAEEKDIFDKMTKKGMIFYYLPNSILFHIIPESKLTNDYFKRLTYSIGKSERERTKQISQKKYYKRILNELIKWGATILLSLRYLISLSPLKGWKLLQFRWNVSKGLLGF